MLKIPSLPDRILATLPSLDAPTVSQMAARLQMDQPRVRAAFDALEASGRAKIVRRGVGLHLVPVGYLGRICPVCRGEYILPPKSKRRTCSRSCGVKMSWRNPETAARRKAAILEERRTPESRARSTAVNNKRWADPEQKKRLSERSRKMWADPVKKMELSVTIQREHLENREVYSRNIKARWDDEAGREKLEAGIKASKSTPDARAKFSKLLSDRWKDPEMRAKYTAGNRARNAKKRAEAEARRASS